MSLFAIDELQLHLAKFISQKSLINLCLAMNVYIFSPALIVAKCKAQFHSGDTGYKCPICKGIVSNNLDCCPSDDHNGCCGHLTAFFEVTFCEICEDNVCLNCSYRCGCGVFHCCAKCKKKDYWCDRCASFSVLSIAEDNKY